MYNYNRVNSSNWSAGDPITSDRLEDFNEDLDSLFSRMDERDMTFTYNVSNQLTQIVDNTNSITVNINWIDFLITPAKIYIQEAWDPKIFTITYSWSTPSTIVYA